MSLHREINLELEICAHLADHGWLYAEGDAENYDRARAVSAGCAGLGNARERANSPDLKAEIVNAIMAALDAHTSLSTQALNSAAVQDGMRSILLDHSKLWETLRAEPGDR